jgi:hypothetical protein
MSAPYASRPEPSVGYRPDRVTSGTSGILVSPSQSGPTGIHPLRSFIGDPANGRRRPKSADRRPIGRSLQQTFSGVGRRLLCSEYGHSAGGDDMVAGINIPDPRYEQGRSGSVTETIDSKVDHARRTIIGVRCLIDGAPTCCITARVSMRRISRTRSTPG